MSFAKEESLENQSSVVYFIYDNNYLIHPKQSILNASIKEAYGKSRWQRYNPLNVLEALTILPANLADRACLMGLPTAADGIGEGDKSAVEVPSVPAKRKILRAMVNFITRIPHKLIQPITSPKKFFFDPLNQLRRQYPKWFAAVIVIVVIATIFIALALFTGLPAFMMAIGAAATQAGAAMAGVAWLSWLGMTAAIVLVKLALTALTLLLSAKLLQVVATEVTGLRQYRLAKLQENARLFDVVEPADESTTDNSLSEKSEATIQAEFQQAENDSRLAPYVKIFAAILEVAQKAYPTLKISIFFNNSHFFNRSRALTGYLLAQSFSQLNLLEIAASEENLAGYLLQQLADKSLNLPKPEEIVEKLRVLIDAAYTDDKLRYLTLIAKEVATKKVVFIEQEILEAAEKLVQAVKTTQVGLLYDSQFKEKMFSQLMPASSISASHSLSTNPSSSTATDGSDQDDEKDEAEATQANSESPKLKVASTEEKKAKKRDKKRSHTCSRSSSRSRDASEGSNELLPTDAEESKRGKAGKKEKKNKKGSQTSSRSSSRSSKKDKTHTRYHSVDIFQQQSQQETTASDTEILTSQSSISLSRLPKLDLTELAAANSDITTSSSLQGAAGYEEKEKKPKRRFSFSHAVSSISKSTSDLSSQVGSWLSLKSSSKDNKASHKHHRSLSVDVQKPVLVEAETRQTAGGQEVDSKRKRSNSEPVALDYNFDQQPKYVAVLREFIGCESEFSMKMVQLANLMKTYETQLKEVEKDPPSSRGNQASKFLLEEEVKKQAEEAKKKIKSALKKLNRATLGSTSELLKKFKSSSKNERLFSGGIKSTSEELTNTSEIEKLTFVEINSQRFKSLAYNPFKEIGSWQEINIDNFDEKLNAIYSIFHDKNFINYFVVMTDIARVYEKLIKLLADFAEENKSQLNEEHLEMLAGGKFAIMPVQRIMRYRLHIQDLRKQYKKETKQDSEALKKLKELGEFIQFITGMANQSDVRLTGSRIHNANAERFSPRQQDINPSQLGGVGNLVASSMAAGGILTASASNTSFSQPKPIARSNSATGFDRI